MHLCFFILFNLAAQKITKNAFGSSRRLFTCWIRWHIMITSGFYVASVQSSRVCQIFCVDISSVSYKCLSFTCAISWYEIGWIINCAFIKHSYISCCCILAENLVAFLIRPIFWRHVSRRNPMISIGAIHISRQINVIGIIWNGY